MGGGGVAYIRVKKRVINFGDLYSGQLIHRGAYLRNFTVHLNTLSLVSCIKDRASQKL